MADFDWKAIVGTVAPTIATALGGPLAGMAVSTVAKALGMSPDAKETDIKDAIAKSNNPELLLKLKEAELTFATKMRELDIDVEKIAAEDRNSARQREVALRDWTPKVLAIFYTVFYFGILLWILKWGLPADTANGSSAKEILNVLFGILSAAQMSIITYYFGSSAGSAKKSIAMEELLKNK